MSVYWSHNDLIDHAVSQQSADLPQRAPLLQAALDILLTGGSFVVITAVMFLQLLFLLVSVWLFCKC